MVDGDPIPSMAKVGPAHLGGRSQLTDVISRRDTMGPHAKMGISRGQMEAQQDEKLKGRRREDSRGGERDGEERGLGPDPDEGRTWRENHIEPTRMRADAVAGMSRRIPEQSEWSSLQRSGQYQGRDNWWSVQPVPLRHLQTTSKRHMVPGEICPDWEQSTHLQGQQNQEAGHEAIGWEKQETEWLEKELRGSSCSHPSSPLDNRTHDSSAP